MEKRIINTPKAPAPIGPYSQAVLIDGTLYCSGQIAIDPSGGQMIQSSIAEETSQVMRNIRAVLEEAGMDFGDIVKTSIFLSDMAHFEQVNQVYGSYFTSDFPARETIAVKQLPKNANVEISVVAVR